MERRIDVSFGVTVKEVSLADLLPLLEEFRRLAGDGKLKLDPKTEHLLQRQVAAALPLPRPAAVVEGDGRPRSAEGDGRGAGAPPPDGGDGHAEDNSRINAFGRLLQTLRTNKGMSRADLSQRSGLDSQYIGKIERGKFLPKVQTCERLARALDCDLTMLYLKVAEEWSARRQRELGLPAQA